MRITSTHARTLAATPEEVGALVGKVASEDDVLWPVDKWPATPIAFDRPLAVGADGGHGLVRYSVSALAPDRVAFRFAPGSGLDGTHELRVEPAPDGRAVLVHHLDVETAWWMRPLAPLLLRAHDELIEDLLDCAQLATGGRVEQANRWPRWLKLANATEALLLRRGRPDLPGRVAGAVVPAVLAALAALHAVWALGSPWPADSREELAEAVLSSSEGMPPDWATWAVAAGLLGAAAVVRRAAGPAPSARVRALALAVAGAFLVRAVAYLPGDVAGGLETTYQQLDLAVYAPLCVLVGTGAAAVGRRHGALRSIDANALA
jgi:uncharacterized protein DUF3995